MSRERILVVEDEGTLRKLLTMQLESAGYVVDVAGDGVEGLAKVLDDPPDLVILDLMMPRMSGSELCRQLKSNYLTHQIPVIMLSALSDIRDKVAGLKLGANDYLTKPHAAEELLGRVRNLLHWSRLQREASPLTGLPGNRAIEAEAQRRLDAELPFSFLYLDIDNFKAFNDYYGYAEGDRAIKLCAYVVARAVQAKGAPDDFVGHVGGDDFVVIAGAESGGPIADEIMAEFDARMPEVYAEADLVRGYIEVANRQSEMQQFPLMSLTIGGVRAMPGQFNHVRMLADVAAELKRYGKRREGSVAVWNRRAEA